MASYDALLEQIRVKAGLDYISDLPRAEHTSQVAAAVEDIAYTEHSVEDWNAVLRYISGRDMAGRSAETARELLLRHCQEH